MKFERVEYESGHWIADNDHGDYDLHCPTGGRLFFVHMGQVMVLQASTCPHCNQVIGPVVSGEPYRFEGGAA